MSFEVENKYRLTVAVGQVEERVASLTGAEFEPGLVEIDQYYEHPDPAIRFRETDEAFRIRSIGNSNRLTYKGPKLDAATKTREEIEVFLEDGPDGRDRMAAMIESLRFAPVLVVRKTRRKASFKFEGRAFEVVLDDVEGLGLFVEIETIAEQQAELDQARDALLKLAGQLDLSEPLRRSYLGMLLEGGEDEEGAGTAGA